MSKTEYNAHSVSKQRFGIIGNRHTRELAEWKIGDLLGANFLAGVPLEVAPAFSPVIGNALGSDNPWHPGGDSAARDVAQGTARHLIWLQMTGGVSHVDTFDYKPALTRLHNQAVPESFTRQLEAECRAIGASPRMDKLLAGPWKWQQFGDGGLWLSDLLPFLSRHADDLCVVKSMYCHSFHHVMATRELLVGTQSGQAVSLGERIVAKLGSGNLELPGLVNLSQRVDGYVADPSGHDQPTWLQDLSDQPQHTLDLYGVDQHGSGAADFGRLCLAARRLVESGVRVVQIKYAADKIGWDGHTDLVGNHRRCAGHVDQPVAGLLSDLKNSGLLDETLVVWASEFGRLPMSQNGHGRDHNPWGYSVWLAGGGVTGGVSVGETDDIGLRAVHDRFSSVDVHNVIMSKFGISASHERGGANQQSRDGLATSNSSSLLAHHSSR